MSVEDSITKVYSELEQLKPNVAELFHRDRLEEKVHDLNRELSLLRCCESPIEQLLLIELFYVEENTLGNYGFSPQREFEIEGRKYRVDILAECHWGEKISYVVVECDGHNFHEKTKEQAAKDKARDRDFQSIGLPVIHFTGSEIFNKAQECAYQVKNILWENLKGPYHE